MADHETTLAEVNELIETSAKISVAYLAMRLRNLENDLSKERAEHAQRIATLEMRLSDAGKEFVRLRRRVSELESLVSNTSIDMYDARLRKLERNGH